MSNRIVRHGALAFAALAAASGGVLAASPARAAAPAVGAAAVRPFEDHCPGGTYCEWNVVNATGGLYWRNSPNVNDRNYALPLLQNGEPMYLFCYEWGSPVGPYGNTLWYFAEDDNNGNVDWINDHYLDTPGTAANPQPQTPQCNS